MAQLLYLRRFDVADCLARCIHHVVRALSLYVSRPEDSQRKCEAGQKLSSLSDAQFEGDGVRLRTRGRRLVKDDMKTPRAGLCTACAYLRTRILSASLGGRVRPHYVDSQDWTASGASSDSIK